MDQWASEGAMDVTCVGSVSNWRRDWSVRKWRRDGSASKWRRDGSVSKWRRDGCYMRLISEQLKARLSSEQVMVRWISEQVKARWMLHALIGRNQLHVHGPGLTNFFTVYGSGSSDGSIYNGSLFCIFVTMDQCTMDQAMNHCSAFLLCLFWFVKIDACY